MFSVDEMSIIASALAILESKSRAESVCITSPDMADNLCRLHLSTFEREVFACAFFDNQHRLISFEKIFFGSISAARVDIRELVKSALSCNAAAVIITHNHPSGSPEPSGSDIEITNRIKQAFDLVDVRLLDHIVVGVEGSVSFASRGLI